MTDATGDFDETRTRTAVDAGPAFYNDLLAAWLDDLENGRERPITEYQAMFPGHEDAVAAELAALRAEADPDPDPEAAPMPPIPDVELIGQIGKGGQGVVYRGRQSYLDREVAVKVLNARGWSGGFAARFRREATTLAALRHPNIVTCYQAGTTGDGLAYMVMEFIDGPNLREWIRENGPMDEATALGLCRDLASALDHAQESNIVHRDVKPENVLLRRLQHSTGEGPAFEVKLADLGLARVTEGAFGDGTVTQLTPVGAVMGSPLTMAPEQFDDPNAVDHRADIYGLGCILYHAMAGRPAFQARTFTGAVKEKVASKLPDLRVALPGTRPEVADLVSSMIAPDVDDRPPTHAAVIAACDRLRGDLEFPHGEHRRRSRRLVPVVVLSVLVLAAVAYVMFPAVFHSPSVVIAATENVVEGQLVTLNAKATERSGTALDYAWSQSGGSPVRMAGIEGAVATFAAPRGQGDTSLAFRVVVSNGWHASSETVHVAIHADPTLVPVPPGVVVPLLRREFGTTLDDWRVTSPTGTWKGAEDHLGADGWCKAGTTRRSRYLPRGSWVITGAVEPIPKWTKGAWKRLDAAGVQLGFSCGNAVQLVLYPDDSGAADGYVARLERVPSGIDDVSSNVDTKRMDLGASVRGGWARKQPLRFTLEWNGTELTAAFGTQPEATDWTRLRIEPRTWPTPYPPSELTVFVTDGNACFCELILTGR